MDQPAESLLPGSPTWQEEILAVIPFQAIHKPAALDAYPRHSRVDSIDHAHNYNVSANQDQASRRATEETVLHSRLLHPQLERDMHLAYFCQWTEHSSSYAVSHLVLRRPGDQ